MRRLLDYLVLPRAVSEFELRYLQRTNRIALWFLLGHLPVFIAVAAINDTGPLAAAVLTAFVLAGPVAAVRLAPPRQVSVVFGFAAMCLGALLVHFGQGMVQIEMHFYFFVLIALLAVFANPTVIVVAAITVALHHGLFWVFLPRSVFNYAAPWWVVGLHALFVVLESVAACFVARSFFDDVIGLERIVRSRTEELEARNRDMRMILDAVDQGLVTVYRDGSMSPQRSAALERWLGAPHAGDSFWAWFERSARESSTWLRVCLEAVFEAELPTEVALSQIPKRVRIGERTLDLAVRPILDGRAVLMVFSDVTATIAIENAAAARRELVVTVERLLHDREAVVEFVAEVGALVESLAHAKDQEPSQIGRTLHTIKGNVGMFGLQRMVALCHTLETEIEQDGSCPPADRLGAVVELWREFCERMQPFIDADDRFDVREDDLIALYEACEGGATVPQVVALVESWRRESAERRLQRLGEQARALAQRLGKSVSVQVQAQRGLRLPRGLQAVWSATVHLLRNSLDHGIESAEQRRAANKPAVASLSLRCRKSEHEFWIEVEDDGRGIDWRRVAERAEAAGLPCSTPEELTEALFADGLSTACSVTEISGRGIGMGAVRHAVVARGGRVSVRSVVGRGTTIVLTFPAAVLHEPASAVATTAAV